MGYSYVLGRIRYYFPLRINFASIIIEAIVKNFNKDNE